MFYRTFFFADPNHTRQTVDEWVKTYNLRAAVQFNTESRGLSVFWSRPEDCTVDELLGRARMLDVMLDSGTAMPSTGKCSASGLPVRKPELSVKEYTQESLLPIIGPTKENSIWLTASEVDALAIEYLYSPDEIWVWRRFLMRMEVRAVAGFATARDCSFRQAAFDYLYARNKGDRA